MTHSVSPDARTIWRAARAPAAVLLIIVAAGIVIALVRGGSDGGSLDPRSTAPSGSRALARLLQDQGVRTDFVETAAAADGALTGGPATLLISHPERIEPDRVAALARRAATVVLVAPPKEVLRALDLPMRVSTEVEVRDRAPDCPLATARAAGVATMGGVRFSGTEVCYGGTLGWTGPVTVLGTGVAFTNDRLDEQGNAALTMRLLGGHDRIVWYVPSFADRPARSERSLVDLLPAGWRFGLIQVVIAVVLLALWRARRLGPVVTEPLPVLVRAAETAEGRAGLYRRSGAAGHAAAALRQATRTRLRARLALPGDAEAGTVSGAVAARSGRGPAEVHDLLYGPPPTTDAALVRLADRLDALEAEVR
ncbi:MAG: DUF4350 domain-containing protein [Labedaea sp.]